MGPLVGSLGGSAGGTPRESPQGHGGRAPLGVDGGRAPVTGFGNAVSSKSIRSIMEPSKNPRFIVSLTTSPTRLNNIGETLDSMLNQTYKPMCILVNLPERFSRTGETYELSSDMRIKYAGTSVVWNHCGPDLGPITKLVPALDAYPLDEPANADVWIVTVDDDIRYLPNTLEAYSHTIAMNGGPEYEGKLYAIGLAGFHFLKQQLSFCPEPLPVHVLEGYGSVAYPRKAFPSSFKVYVHALLENDDCRLSDDFIISNYLALQGVLRVIASYPFMNRRIFWAKKCILDMGNGPDALHNGAGGKTTGNGPRYLKAAAHLQTKRLLANEFVPEALPMAPVSTIPVRIKRR